MGSIDPDIQAEDEKELLRDLVGEVEEALFLTITAAVKAANEDNHSLHEMRVARAESRTAWRDFVDKAVDLFD